MALIGTYSPGGPGGSASSNRYTTLDELLIQLPDNTSNLIVAQDIRDSVYTLWERISDVETIALTAASSSSGVLYTNANPTLITLGGFTAGSTFLSYSQQQMWDGLLYPYIAPGANLSISSNTTREYGYSTYVNLNWSVEKKSELIVSPITVEGNLYPASGVSQSGTSNTYGTHSNVPVSPTFSQTFTMSVSDGLVNTVANTTLTWSTRIYWGRIDLSSIGNPNLTLYPGSASLCATIATDGIIQSLNGASANGQAFGSELSGTKTKTYNGIDGSGQYLIFAWPSIVYNPYYPLFTVNGNINNAFTRIRTNSPLLRNGAYSVSGFSGVNYEVWISNTLQNSSIDVIIS